MGHMGFIFEGICWLPFVNHPKKGTPKNLRSLFLHCAEEHQINGMYSVGFPKNL